MVEFSYKEYFNDITEGANDAIHQAGEAARNFYCRLYRRQPSWIIRNNILISPLVRKGLEDMCQMEVPPPPEIPREFFGGQCCDTIYDVTVRGLVYRCTEGRVFSNTEATRRVEGKVLGVDVGVFPPDPRFTAVYVTTETCDLEKHYYAYWSGGQDFSPNYCLSPVPGGENMDYIDGVRSRGIITNIVPVVGDDDCGDPPGGYPPVPPPDDEDIVEYAPIVYNDNTFEYAPVTINRSEDDYIYFPPVINVGDLSISFDVTGVRFGDTNINNNSGGGGSGGSTTTTNNSNNRRTRERNVFSGGGGGEMPESPELVAVKVTITVIPDNASTQWGNGSPDIIYAGWFEYVTEEHAHPRCRMDFEKNYYLAPPGQTGYAYCFKEGFRGTIAEVTVAES